MSNQNYQNSETLVERNFMLPDMVQTTFTAEELAEDMDGLLLSFQRIKIPSGGALQFEIPSDNPDNPEYEKYLEGVILYNHSSNAYWDEGSEYDDNTPPLCQSMDGKIGHGTPGGLCYSCPNNEFGSGPKGKGKACKNMRVIYLLRSGDYMPVQISLPPTSIRPFNEFVNQAFLLRKRGICSAVVQIGLKRMNNGKDDYSVATFKRLYDFEGEELAKVRAYADQFREQAKLMLSQRAELAEAGSDDVEVQYNGAMNLPDNQDRFATPIVDAERDPLP